MDGTAPQAPFACGSQVVSTQYGRGRVEMNRGNTVLVRFGHGYEECLLEDLVPVRGLEDVIVGAAWHSPLSAVARTQALAVRSANDAWGIFSRSRIALLPHQLWVCKRVREQWPTRWLVADDVGLGKTIEAGLVLLPLISSGLIRRLLVLAPAGLVGQWQQRMRDMFDIRLSIYTPEADGDRTDFWGTHPFVAASMHTLRLDRRNRWRRMLEAEPWDMVVVDEAHHLNDDDQGGPTLAYELLGELNERRLTNSMLFFTGTPHRGKTYGFLSLLSLLRPDLFDPKAPLDAQLAQLRHAVIRNNKQSATDMAGQKIFTPVHVSTETYRYSPAEAHFYATLTEFIQTGKAYASSLSATEQKTVILVLITMQKLASSSVAAVRKALLGRLGRIRDSRRDLGRLRRRHTELKEIQEYEALGENADPSLGDELAALEERIADIADVVRLMEDEEPLLEELVEAAEDVEHETKVERLVEIIDERFRGQQVLLFTEYKATQSLLMNTLQRHFGHGCVTFINGDGRAEGIEGSQGRLKPLVESRVSAAERFNKGEVRFLVSTEAAGEGIDLQERCHALIHADLPWNPMRLHQRVGRLSRYGQQHPVEVVSLRNPDTVESLIWEKLNAKLERITQALSAAMDEPEDLLQLVLGMTSPKVFTGVFADAAEVSKEKLNSWFDVRTSRLGGQDVIDAVKSLVGNVARFDYREVKADIPRADLPDLEPFFRSMLALQGRRVTGDGGELSFKTPEAWLDDFALLPAYERLVFDRSVRGRDAAARVLGAGHRLFDRALRDAIDLDATVAAVPGLAAPLAVFRVRDRVTGGANAGKQTVCAVEAAGDGLMLLRDWELLLRLNALPSSRAMRGTSAGGPAAQALSVLRSADEHVATRLPDLRTPYRSPEIEPLVLLWPADS